MKKFFLLLPAIFISLLCKSQGLTNNGATLVIPSGAVITVSGASGHYTNLNNGSTNGSVELNGTMVVNGNWVNNAGGVFIGASTTDGTVQFTGTAVQDIGGSSTTQFEIVTLNKSAGSVSVSASSMVTRGNFTITNGTFDANNQNISIAGNYANSGTLTADNSSFTFNGTATQTLSPGTGGFYNVIFFNTSSGNNNLVIAQPMQINGSATFTDGIVNYSGSGSLTFGNTGSSNGGATGSFVNGAVSKTGTSAFIFPVGEVNGSTPVWAPLSIAAPASASTITADYNFSGPGNNYDSWNMCDFAVLNHTSGVEYWSLTTTASTPAVTLYWKDASRSGINDPTAITVAQWENCSGSPKWVQKGGSGVDQGSGAGYVTSNLPFTAYSTKITFGSTKGSNPLPVELLSFTAECVSSGARLEWSTATETNNDHFSVEYSHDAIQWETIATIQGAGNSNQVNHYSYTDPSSHFGTSYYRLTQTDFDGKTEIFSPVDIRCQEAPDLDVAIYPNPFKSEIYIAMNNYLYNDAGISVYDMIGNVIAWQNFDYIENNRMFTSFDLSNIASGMYFVEIKSGDFARKFKIVKN